MPSLKKTLKQVLVNILYSANQRYLLKRLTVLNFFYYGCILSVGVVVLVQYVLVQWLGLPCIVVIGAFPLYLCISAVSFITDGACSYTHVKLLIQIRVDCKCIQEVC